MYRLCIRVPSDVANPFDDVSRLETEPRLQRIGLFFNSVVMQRQGQGEGINTTRLCRVQIFWGLI